MKKLFMTVGEKKLKKVKKVITKLSKEYKTNNAQIINEF